MSVRVTGTAWKDGEPITGQFELGVRETHIEALALLRSYITTMVIGGATATFDRTADEFKLVRSDGVAEYLPYPKAGA